MERAYREHGHVLNDLDDQDSARKIEVNQLEDNATQQSKLAQKV